VAAAQRQSIDELIAAHKRDGDVLDALLPLVPLLVAGEPLTPERVFRRCGARRGAFVLRLINWLPKSQFAVPGSLHTEYRSCGVFTCSRCGGTQAAHGPYTFHHWREDGRQRREYVHQRDVAWVQAAVERWAAAHPDGRRDPPLLDRIRRVRVRQARHGHRAGTPF
jgi:hypothetical protein